MLATVSPSAEDASRASRRTAMGFRAALEELHGEAGVQDVLGRLPSDAIASFFAATQVDTKWVPEKHLLVFMEAVLAGPCGRNRLKFAEWSALQIQRGFGRVRAAMIRVATPELLASRAAALWREEHTDGTLTAQVAAPRTAVLRLTQHPYAEHPLARAVLTESLRTIVSKSLFVNTVRGSFEVIDERELVMTIAWT